MTDILSRYKRANAIMEGYLTNRLVQNDAVFPHWIFYADGSGSQCFWYIRDTKKGREFRWVDARAATNTPAFDHQWLASLLTELTGQPADAHNLPLRDVVMEQEANTSALNIRFQFAGRAWLLNNKTKLCQEDSTPQPPQENELSPCKTKYVFVKAHNLWLQDLSTGQEQPLTEDGTKDYSYGTAIVGMDRSVQARWSPDGRFLFTVQLDVRQVNPRHQIDYIPPGSHFHPTLTPIKLAYTGDEHIESYRLLVIDISTGQQINIDYPQLPYLNHGAENLAGFFTGNLGWWSKDSKHVYFVDVARGSTKVSVLCWDILSGAIKVLFEEEANTYFKICDDGASCPLFIPLPASNELIWYSDRSGWPHLYLYDLESGRLKKPITQGDWLVRGILHYDATRRELLLQSAGRDPDINPYYRDLCKVNIDTGRPVSLLSGDFDCIIHSMDHGFSMKNREGARFENDSGVNPVSPCGQYVVMTYSRVDTVPVSVLIDRDGSPVLTLETTDISGLPENWQWPESVKLKAADGETDIYGVVCFPPDFSADKSYPVIDFLGAMQIASHIPCGSFCNSHYSFYFDMPALASLGFIVVSIAGRGTGARDKTFQDHNFGQAGGEDDLNDHIAGIRQLAERYPSMDLERVGITSMEHSYTVIYSLLRHSDFYRVCVSHAFQDYRCGLYLYEMYSGIHDTQALSAYRGPEDHIDSFQGKLLLIYGQMFGADSTYRLMDALQRANKDFESICIPHMGAGVSSYTRRRGWDYLVKHLLGIEPPVQFPLRTGIDILIEENADGMVETWQDMEL